VLDDEPLFVEVGFALGGMDLFDDQRHGAQSTRSGPWYNQTMAMDGHRFVLERNKLCVWLAAEKRKLDALPVENKAKQAEELEREFKTRLERLYGEVVDFTKRKGVKLN